MTINLNNETPSNNNEEIKELLRQNLELTKEIHDMTHKIKGYITFQKIMSFIYFILIVGPIVLSVIYLPAILNSALGQYKELLSESPIDPEILKNLQNGNVQIPPAALEMLKKK